MANPMLGEAPLGDCTLAFNFGAFCKLERRTGRKTQELLEAMGESLSFNDLADFVWAGLQLHHEATDEAVQALLDEQGYQLAADAVGEAVKAFFDVSKEKAKGPLKAAA